MEDRLQHFAAHPYYLMGVKAEPLRIIEILRNLHEQNTCDPMLKLCSACVTYELLFPVDAA